MAEAELRPEPGPETRYTVHELPPEEWGKLLHLPPWSDMGRVTLRPGSDRVVVIEERETGEILGYWFGWWAFHVEPLYLSPPVRGNGNVIKRLWAAVQRMLTAVGVDVAFAVIHPSNPAANYARRLGFRPAPGLAYFWQDPALEARVAEGLAQLERRSA